MTFSIDYATGANCTVLKVIFSPGCFTNRDQRVSQARLVDDLQSRSVIPTGTKESLQFCIFHLFLFISKKFLHIV
jgi:hypothetical protein